MEKVQLGSIDIGGGVFAFQAWLSDGPIVVVGTRRAGGVEQNTRLDLQKGMFIDPLPGDRTEDGVTKVVDSVRTHGHL